jgi:hypothetical protein
MNADTKGGNEMSLFSGSVPLVGVVGVALGVTFVERSLKTFGYEEYIPLVNLIGWGIAGYLTLDWYFGQVHAIGGIIR